MVQPILVITLRSGREIYHLCDPQKDGMTAEECCKMFHDDIEFSKLITIRLGANIVMCREIESVRFSVCSIDNT